MHNKLLFQTYFLERVSHSLTHSDGPSKVSALHGIALYHVTFAVLLECFFRYTLSRAWSYIILPDNSTPIKIYEFVLKAILDYVSVYEASHEHYILYLNLTVVPRSSNKKTPYFTISLLADLLLAAAVATQLMVLMMIRICCLVRFVFFM